MKRLYKYRYAASSYFRPKAEDKADRKKNQLKNALIELVDVETNKIDVGEFCKNEAQEAEKTESKIDSSQEQPKYPPIGLMKIAMYHKMRGDYVEFYKGTAPFQTITKMDRIYITSIFTFFFDITVETILHYAKYIDRSTKELTNICSDIISLGFVKDEATYIPENPAEIFYRKIDRRIYSNNSTWIVVDKFIVFFKKFINRIKKESVQQELIGIVNELDDADTPLPSGKLATNKLVLELTILAYNILRMIGQMSLESDSAPKTKEKIKRRRLRTVINNLILIAGHITKHSRKLILALGRSNVWRFAFFDLWQRFVRA